MIVAAVRTLTTWLGGVSTFVKDNRIIETDDSNVIFCGQLLLGLVCDLPTIHKVKRLSFKCPLISPRDHVIGEILPALLSIDKNIQALAAWDNNLFIIDGESVTSPTNPYAVIGDGADIALGVLAITKSMTPPDRLKLALGTVAKHVPTVRPPWHIQDAMTFHAIMRANGK